MKIDLSEGYNKFLKEIGRSEENMTFEERTYLFKKVD